MKIKTHMRSAADTRSIPWNTIVLWTSVVVLIVLFVYTGSSKIIYHKTFTWQLGKQPLPLWWKPILRYALPVVELSIVGLLSVERSRKLGFVLASLLMFSYSIYAYLAYSMYFGHVVCACGQIFRKIGWEAHFWVNLGMTTLAIAGYWICCKERKNTTIFHTKEQKKVQKE